MPSILLGSHDVVVGNPKSDHSRTAAADGGRPYPTVSTPRDATEAGQRESLTSLLRHTTYEPIFLPPRAWTDVHLRLLRCAFLPTTTAPAAEGPPSHSLTREQNRVEKRAIRILRVNNCGSSVSRLLKVVHGWKGHVRPLSLHILEWELELYSYPLGAPYPTPTAFSLPGDSRVGLICVDYASVASIRRWGMESAWQHLKKKKIQHFLTLPLYILEQSVPVKGREFEDPYIAVMLIAVAQARRSAQGDVLVCQVLLHHGNTNIHLYTAAIPRALLSWLDNPTIPNKPVKSISKAAIKAPPGVPDWDPIGIERLDIPFEPAQNFYLRLDDAIRSERVKLGEHAHPRGNISP